MPEEPEKPGLGGAARTIWLKELSVLQENHCHNFLSVYHVHRSFKTQRAMDEPFGPGIITGMTCSGQVFTLFLGLCSAVWRYLGLCGQPHGQLRALVTPALPLSLTVWGSQTDLYPGIAS